LAVGKRRLGPTARNSANSYIEDDAGDAGDILRTLRQKTVLLADPHLPTSTKALQNRLERR
jgi:hypothetical protein